MIRCRLPIVVSLASRRVFLGEGQWSSGRKGCSEFGRMIDRRRVTNQREREMKQTDIAQRKEEKERNKHKGKEREKRGVATEKNIAKGERYQDESDRLGFRKSRA